MLVMFVVYVFGEIVFFYYFGKVICWVKVNFKSVLGLYCIIMYFFNMFLMYLVIYFSYYKVFRKICVYFVYVVNIFFYSDSLIVFVEEVKVIIMLFVIVVVFIICWIFINIVDFYEIFVGYYILLR